MTHTNTHTDTDLHLVDELGVEVADTLQGGIPKGAAEPGASAQARAAIRGEQTQIHSQDRFHEGQHGQLGEEQPINNLR